MGEISLEANTVNKFISSLSKSIQALCHGCMDFNSSIEMIGYININIDSSNVVDCVLNEKVRKSTANSVTCISNSFPAKKDKPKTTKDGSCSPIRQSEDYSKITSTKRQNDCRGEVTHRESVKKRPKYHPTSVIPTSQYYSTSESSCNEHVSTGLSEFSHPEQYVKSEMHESSASTSSLDLLGASTSHDFSVKNETDFTSETFSESHDIHPAKDAGFGNGFESLGESSQMDSEEQVFDEGLGESSHIESQDESGEPTPSNFEQEQKDIKHFEADDNRGEKSSHSHPSPEDVQDTEAFHRRKSDQDSLIESKQDAQFEVIEIGDDDEDMQGLFENTGTQSMMSHHQQMLTSSNLYPLTTRQGLLSASEYLASMRDKNKTLSRTYRLNRTNEQIERERWLARIRQRRRRARLRGRLIDHSTQEGLTPFVIHRP